MLCVAQMQYQRLDRAPIAIRIMAVDRRFGRDRPILVRLLRAYDAARGAGQWSLGREALHFALRLIAHIALESANEAV
jgi:hypothetical protein